MSIIDQTRIVVEKYQGRYEQLSSGKDQLSTANTSFSTLSLCFCTDALHKIASLTKINHNLMNTVRANELKMLRLAELLQTEVDAQTRLAAELKEEKRRAEEEEVQKRQRMYKDKATWIVESKEAELISLIDLLEDEIAALKKQNRCEAEEFERRAILHEAKTKQSFLDDIDVLRRRVSETVCLEAGDALQSSKRPRLCVSLSETACSNYFAATDTVILETIQRSR